MVHVSPAMKRWIREMPHVVQLRVEVPRDHNIETLTQIALGFTEWLEQQGVLVGDFMVDRAPTPLRAEMRWTYRFRSARIATMFKLTFGGT